MLRAFRDWISEMPLLAASTMNAQLGNLEFGLGFEYDAATRTLNKTAVEESTPQDYYTAKQGFYPERAYDNFRGGIDFILEERFSSEAISETFGDSYALTITPRLQHEIFSGRTVARLESPLLTLRETFGDKNLILRATPLVGLRWYATPWLLWNASVSYEYSRTTASATGAASTAATVSKKPAASLMATMIF